MFFVGPVRLLPGHIHAGVDVEGKLTVIDIRPQTLWKKENYAHVDILNSS